MRPDYERLVLSVFVAGLLTFMTIMGLKHRRLKTRWGIELTANERPFSFYATIFFYVLVAGACIFQAIRSAKSVLFK